MSETSQPRVPKCTLLFLCTVRITIILLFDPTNHILGRESFRIPGVGEDRLPDDVKRLYHRWVQHKEQSVKL